MSPVNNLKGPNLKRKKQKHVVVTVSRKCIYLLLTNQKNKSLATQEVTSHIATGNSLPAQADCCPMDIVHLWAHRRRAPELQGTASHAQVLQSGGNWIYNLDLPKKFNKLDVKIFSERPLRKAENRHHPKNKTIQQAPKRNHYPRFPRPSFFKSIRKAVVVLLTTLETTLVLEF